MEQQIEIREMIRTNKELPNPPSLRSIKSETNLRKNSRMSSISKACDITQDKRAQGYSSQTHLPNQNSAKTFHKPPIQPSKLRAHFSPDVSVKEGVIRQFNELFSLHRSNDLNSDIESIEKYKKEMERAFKELKRLEEQHRESLKAMEKMASKVKKLEEENKDLKRLNDYKDNLIFTMEEKIRMLLDEGAMIEKCKSLQSLDILAHTANQSPNQSASLTVPTRTELIDLSKFSPRLCIPKPPKQLATSTLSPLNNNEIQSLQQRLRTNETSLGFYKQRERELQFQISQLEKHLAESQGQSKNSLEANKNTIMMLYAQAACLESFL